MSGVSMQLRSLLFGLLAAALSQAAGAQAPYPDHPIKILVPFAPGGATDILARIVANGLAEKLGQPVVIENKPGAATIVAATAVAKAPPDGYTLMVASASTLTVNPVLRRSLPYDPIRSFSHLGPMARMDLVIVVNKDSPVMDLKGFVDRVRSSPGTLSYATFGAGSSVHFAAEMLFDAATMKMVHVPYNGSSPSLAALLGNQVNSAFDTAVASGPFIKSGRLRALAVLSSHRSASLPDVPTVTESGYPDVNYDTWFTLVGPAGLSTDVRRKLESALEHVLRTPSVRKQLLDAGLIPDPGTAASVVERIESEVPRLRAIAARANMPIE
jgi:tripartite-type tricarboxylate transporter receptor subunit TctC